MSKLAYTPAAAPAAVDTPPQPPNLCESGRTCRLTLSFSIFFDGTRNHLAEDASSGSQSNVAKLYKATFDKPEDGQYAFYLQGVGTPFPEIGENTPHPDGAAKGAMGAERIRYALLFAANRIYWKLTRQLLVADSSESIKNAVKNDDLFERWKRQLTHALSSSRNPKIDSIVFDVFGFSRGAAEARSFLNQLRRHFCDVRGFYCGVPMRVRFLGLFDTVVSVGYADSVPGPVTGHQGWGDESLMTIPDPGEVEQCVHLVAAHEARHSFPADLARRPHAYQRNCLEVVYPGMHSDVGGGYGLYSQGKGTYFSNGRVANTQADKLSQIPLNDMYERAVAAGVPLRSREEIDRAGLKDDFAIRPELQSAFDAYMAATDLGTGKASVEEQLLAHRRLYLGWRKQILDSEIFAGQPFVRRSGGQDRNDMIEANEEFGRQLREIEAFPAKQRAWLNGSARLDGRSRQASAPRVPIGYEFHEDWHQAAVPRRSVASFFAQYVHDSRAHFLLTDPQSERDHEAIRDRLEKEDADYRAALKRHRDAVASERAYRSGHHRVGVITRPPSDPLSVRQRSILELYRQGRKPLYTDRAPSSSTDGVTDLLDLVNQMGGRREPDWSYLHKRQIFAVNRMTY